MGEVVVAEILAVGRQLVVDNRGQHLLQLQEETLARGVAVGEHVEGVTGTVPAVHIGICSFKGYTLLYYFLNKSEWVPVVSINNTSSRSF